MADGRTFVLAVTEKMVVAARARLLRAAHDAGTAARLGFEEAAPGFTAAVVALPELRLVLGLAAELRGPILDALQASGAVIPRETWVRLGAGFMFDWQKMRDAACSWSLCALDSDLEAAGCAVDRGVVVWPSVYELPELPRELRTAASAESPKSPKNG